MQESDKMPQPATNKMPQAASVKNLGKPGMSYARKDNLVNPTPKVSSGYRATPSTPKQNKLATSIPDKIIGNRPRWQKVAATIVADSRKASLGAMPIPMPIAKGSPSGQ